MEEASKKDCYGVLKEVFPIGKQGLREVSPKCQNCPGRVECLRKAISTDEGLEMRSKVVERSAGGGFRGLLKRWSHHKELSRQKEKQKVEKG